MDIFNTIKERRSIRKYQEREIPEDVLREILEHALWAPSGVNRQNWQIYVLKGRPREELVQVIAQAGKYMKPRLDKLLPEKTVNITLQFFKNLGGAPVLLLVYIPKAIYNNGPEIDSIEKHKIKHERLNNLLSASALIQNILLLAKARGLGTCWMTGPKHVEDQINDFMKINDQELVSIIPIGYPDQNPPAPPRKGEKIHWIGF